MRAIRAVAVLVVECAGRLRRRRWQIGEATLEPEFRARLLREYAPKLEDAGKKYNVEVIEIVGHTDELPIRDVQSRLDNNLLPFLNGKGAERDVIAGDNAGLGLARAAAVQRVLRDIKGLTNFRILPMSAGQVVDTDQTVSTGGKPADDPTRRRIEIRMRRLK
jgi:flagellar motor protein MotB